MKNFSKIISGLLFILILSIFVKSTYATEVVQLDVAKDESNSQSCSVQTYEVDADEDSDTHLEFSESGGKIEIIFNDLDGTLPSEDDRDQVIINTGTGYEIVNVQYELEHYSGIGWIMVPGSNPTTIITLTGTDDDSRIDEVEVKLKTICVTPTTITETPTPTPTITPTPTNQPSNNDKKEDKKDNGGGSSPQQTTSNQAVLGASTMAGTGTFKENLMNLYAVFGMLLLTAGYISYAKEKKFN